jgi:hypothetical protein
MLGGVSMKKFHNFVCRNTKNPTNITIDISCGSSLIIRLLGEVCMNVRVLVL